MAGYSPAGNFRPVDLNGRLRDQSDLAIPFLGHSFLADCPASMILRRSRSAAVFDPITVMRP
jgi:hypothetical protein